MKIIMVLVLLPISLICETINLSNPCPQHQVLSSSSICIMPFFIEGCLTYSTVNTCQICSQQYELLNGKCSLTGQAASITNALVGCLQISNGECINCANGFQQVNGTCQYGIINCQIYNQDGSCKECFDEYSLIFNQCKHNLILGCKTEQSDHTCSQCWKPFKLVNRQCVIEHCSSYNDYGCYACECDYFITSQRFCQKMQEGCLKYNRGLCAQCKTGYKLKKGVCTIQGCLSYKEQVCSSCSQGYDLVDGLCILKNCESWQNGSCLICTQGFNLYRGTCIPSSGQLTCSC